jgi:uncharacterized phage protein (TIGR02220 family)
MSNNIIIFRTINYLNSVTGKNYNQMSFANDSGMCKLIGLGYGYQDFKRVIDLKLSQWKGTTYEQYLRPSTLFGNKFENYINEQSTSESKLAKLNSSVQRAKSANWRLDKK